METAMDGREDRSLTELDGIDRNAIANTRDIEQKWRRIQTDLAQMGGLRTELAMQRGQQILSVIANVMGEESNETQIQERINNITGLLAKESVEELAGLKNITKALRDRVKASMGTGTTDAAANARINQAIRNAQQVLTMIKQIEKMNASDLQYESKVRDISRQVVQRVQSADFKGAGALINTIIAEIQKETGYLAQIDQIILRVRPLLTAEVQEVHSLLR